MLAESSEVSFFYVYLQTNVLVYTLYSSFECKFGCEGECFAAMAATPMGQQQEGIG